MTSYVVTCLNIVRGERSQRNHELIQAKRPSREEKSYCKTSTLCVIVCHKCVLKQSHYSRTDLLYRSHDRIKKNGRKKEKKRMIQ